MIQIIKENPDLAIQTLAVTGANLAAAATGNPVLTAVATLVNIGNVIVVINKIQNSNSEKDNNSNG